MDNLRKCILVNHFLSKGCSVTKCSFCRNSHPELNDEISDSQETIFADGRDVGIAAWELFPGGVEIPYEGLSHQEQLDLTQQKINEVQKTIYESIFSHQGVFVKVDILHKGKTGWDDQPNFHSVPVISICVE